ncbi:hypothetical protein F4780DRAFT_743577 [Xylariomycetidae sp. FL0641]|nr:hypothetical protein F4780DRAFT_743577 [Xylariomycetidae sp. FL0641]
MASGLGFVVIVVVVVTVKLWLALWCCELTGQRISCELRWVAGRSSGDWILALGLLLAAGRSAKIFRGTYGVPFD